MITLLFIETTLIIERFFSYIYYNFSFNPDPTQRDGFWAVVIGLTFMFTAQNSINQGCIQKFLALPSMSDAKKSCFIYTQGCIIAKTLSILIGLTMYAIFAGCDPFTTKRVERNDQLVPYFIVGVGSSVPGLAGLFFAGVFCAALRKIVLLLVGLDNAGKTVAANGLAGESIIDVIPTVGFHAVKLSYKNFIVNIYDLGGATNFRGLWPKYFCDAFGIIFVIDSSDIDRLDEAKQVLESVLSHEKISGKPLLFLANKQDEENALDEIDLHEKLNLEDLVNTCHCPTLVECCSATYSVKKTKVDPGILNGFIWLMSYIDKNYAGLNKRVIADISQQENIEKILRDQINKRIHEAKKLEESNDENAIELYSEYAKKLNSYSSNGENGYCVLNTKKFDDISIDEFPPLYYGSVQKQSVQRPSSAREFVRNQLQINCNGFASTKINKTLPINLIGMKLSNSAKERSKSRAVSRRILKSAGDIKTSVHLPNMVFPKENADNFECSDMKIFHKNCQFLPIDISPKINVQNRISWSKSEDENEISFINIS